MSKILKKMNQNWWIFPLLVFVVVESILVAISFVVGPILLAMVEPGLRKDIYSSLTGSSSGLLGFSLAAVAILAAFSPRVGAGVNRTREQSMAEARGDIAKCLLATSFLLMIVLVVSTIGIGIDTKGEGNLPIVSLVVAAAFASIIGLLISGLGVTLSILERNSLGVQTGS
ncbi:hypothetical protein QWM81_09920 [Streptomyces ficellus]|uniref:DUF2975 domain-containing protein n=1 Tax=Streptomyces ficellus TaxID=1977088 RepID=A0ABT7Z4K3_9ACTN|nr:hypothetical protein [Streptomyces ficellus]MDN3294361.1 hypothetical protein [Streptomyces ficellus]